jgi:hypothetical protein
VLRQQVRVPALSAGTVQYSRTDRKLQQLDEARDLAAIALRIEQRLVLAEILLVEVAAPPLADRGKARQKNTGSR